MFSSFENPIEDKNLFEVKLSQGITWSSLEKHLREGKTVKFIVVEDLDIILGEGLHEVIAEENGIDFGDIDFEGQFALKENHLKWGYPDIRRQNNDVEEKIEDFLISRGFNINK